MLIQEVDTTTPVVDAIRDPVIGPSDVADALQQVDVVASVADTLAVQVIDAFGMTDWISVGLTAGLVLVAVVAIVIEVWREKLRAKERESRADGQVSADAYLLRRQLQASFENTPDDPEFDLEFLQWAVKLGQNKNALDTTQNGIVQLAGHRIEASPEVAAAVTDAYVFFLAATKRITFLVRSVPVDNTSENFAASRKAFAEMKKCIGALDEAIDVDLRDR